MEENSTGEGWFEDSIRDERVEDNYWFLSETGSNMVCFYRQHFYRTFHCMEKFTERIFYIKIIIKNAPNRRNKLSAKKLIVLDHPNLIRVKEIYETTEAMYVVMEPFHENISDDFIQKGFVSERDVAQAIKSTLLALKYLHKRGILHRYINPENVVVVMENGDINIKLDNAVLGTIVPEEVHNALITNNISFTAPELMRSTEKKVASDLWSVGVLTYYLFSGIIPFYDHTYKGCLNKVFNSELNWHNDYPFTYTLQDFIKRLVVTDPDKRMTTEEALGHPWIAGGLNSIKPLLGLTDKLGNNKKLRTIKLNVDLVSISTYDRIMQKHKEINSSTILNGLCAPVIPITQQARSVIVTAESNFYHLFGPNASRENSVHNYNSGDTCRVLREMYPTPQVTTYEEAVRCQMHYRSLFDVENYIPTYNTTKIDTVDDYENWKRSIISKKIEDLKLILKTKKQLINEAAEEEEEEDEEEDSIEEKDEKESESTEKKSSELDEMNDDTEIKENDENDDDEGGEEQEEEEQEKQKEQEQEQEEGEEKEEKEKAENEHKVEANWKNTSKLESTIISKKEKTNKQLPKKQKKVGSAKENIEEEEKEDEEEDEEREEEEDEDEILLEFYRDQLAKENGDFEKSFVRQMSSYEPDIQLISELKVAKPKKKNQKRESALDFMLMINEAHYFDILDPDRNYVVEPDDVDKILESTRAIHRLYKYRPPFHPTQLGVDQFTVDQNGYSGDFTPSASQSKQHERDQNYIFCRLGTIVKEETPPWLLDKDNPLPLLVPLSLFNSLVKKGISIPDNCIKTPAMPLPVQHLTIYDLIEDPMWSRFNPFQHPHFKNSTPPLFQTTGQTSSYPEKVNYYRDLHCEDSETKTIQICNFKQMRDQVIAARILPKGNSKEKIRKENFAAKQLKKNSFCDLDDRKFNQISKPKELIENDEGECEHLTGRPCRLEIYDAEGKVCVLSKDGDRRLCCQNLYALWNKIEADHKKLLSQREILIKEAEKKFKTKHNFLEEKNVKEKKHKDQGNLYVPVTPNPDRIAFYMNEAQKVNGLTIEKAVDGALENLKKLKILQDHANNCLETEFPAFDFDQNAGHNLHVWSQDVIM